MSDTVSIPAETARAMAAWLRSDGGDLPSATVDAWADALDPRPTLRDAVAQALRVSANSIDSTDDYTDDEAYDLIARDALAVVRDHIAALRTPWGEPSVRDVLALLDGADR